MGWENKFHCEWNEFGQKILKYYWPKAISYEDITKTDFSIWRGKIDILTGGFPCQPYSNAGKRLGKEDNRHLWPEMFRAIREIKPRFVVGENVYGIVNWNGGLVFDEIQTDLENEGYEVQTFILPAASVGAWHRRDRVWFIGYSNEWGKQEQELSTGREVFKNNINRTGAHVKTNNTRTDKRLRDNGKREEKNKGREKQLQSEFGEISGNVTDTDSSMRKRRESRDKTKGRSKSNEKQFRRHDKLYRTDFEKFPTQPPIYNGNDGLSDRLDGITFPKWRNESIKGGGNAIIPQVAFQIFKAIKKLEDAKM